jgi:hypothetical protein
VRVSVSDLGKGTTITVTAAKPQVDSGLFGFLSFSRRCRRRRGRARVQVCF